MTASSLTLTDRAAVQITQLLAKEPAGTFFRLAVSGGGCAGFQYGFSFDDTQQPDDVVIENGQARLLIDTASLSLLAGGEVDYVEDLMGAAFQLRNPNAKSACGCGSSFSIG